MVFVLGLGVPVAMTIIALWQWQRVGALPTVPVTSLRYYGQRSPWVHDALALLAPLTLLLGVLATASFCAALVAIRRATARAMQSRDALMQAFENGRRWLPKFMLSQTVLVFGGLITLLSFEAIIILSRPGVSDGGVKLGVFLAMVALALAWYGFKMLYGALRQSERQGEPEPILLMGQSLAPHQAPRLWEFVREIAKRTDARAPDAVVVGLNEGFFVTEHPVALVSGQPVPEGRVLYLPLPYMAFLDRAQVSAVIAHELGHFTGEDTGYSLRFAPIYRSFLDSIFSITNEHDEKDDGSRVWVAAPVTLYGKWFLASFEEAMHHWSRERELAADAFGSRIAGTESSALALLRISGLHRIVDAALAHNQQAPAEERGGVLKMVRRLVAEHGLDDPQERLQDQQAHPLDSHPSLKQRLDALGVAITPELLARARDPRDAALLVELGLESAVSA